MLDRLANAFPIWVLAACGLALVEPALFVWFRGEAIVCRVAVGFVVSLTLKQDRGLHWYSIFAITTAAAHRDGIVICYSSTGFSPLVYNARYLSE